MQLPAVIAQWHSAFFQNPNPRVPTNLPFPCLLLPQFPMESDHLWAGSLTSLQHYFYACIAFCQAFPSPETDLVPPQCLHQQLIQKSSHSLSTSSFCWTKRAAFFWCLPHQEELKRCCNSTAFKWRKCRLQSSSKQVGTATHRDQQCTNAGIRKAVTARNVLILCPKGWLQNKLRTRSIDTLNLG